MFWGSFLENMTTLGTHFNLQDYHPLEFAFERKYGGIWAHQFSRLSDTWTETSSSCICSPVWALKAIAGAQWPRKRGNQDILVSFVLFFVATWPVPFNSTQKESKWVNLGKQVNTSKYRKDRHISILGPFQSNWAKPTWFGFHEEAKSTKAMLG